MVKILIIEDEMYLRDNLREALEVHDYEVIEAKDGEMGVKLAINHLPDLVISDIMMPKMDGYQVIEALREHDETSTIPVILLTAKVAKEDMRRGMGLGAADYLTKPYTNDELLEAVNTRLNMKNQVDITYSRALNELRTNLTQALPHELRTPLAPIINVAQIMVTHADKVSENDVQEFGGLILRGAERLSHLIENYISISELELIANNPEKLQYLQSQVTYHASETIEDVVYLYFANDEKRAADFDMQLEDTALPIASNYLKNIITEILDNACKFSEAGTPIRMRTRIVDNHLNIDIVDKGRGMKPEQIKQIGLFKQFERDKHEQQGMGLGLAIVKRTVELHGGTVGFKSKVGIGCHVRITLPLVHEPMEQF